MSKKDSEDAMNTATIENEMSLLRLLAIAMDKVQRRRHRPKKQGRLHRV